MLWRDEGDLGTTVVSLMFDTLDDDKIATSVIVDQIRDAVNLNFWPLIHDKELEVTVKGAGTEHSISETTLLSELEPFIRAAGAIRELPDNQRMNAESWPEAFVEIEIRVPERTADKTHDSVNGKVRLGITIISEDEANALSQFESRCGSLGNGESLTNSIAMARGARMVVKYLSIGDLGSRFVAVLRAGGYREPLGKGVKSRNEDEVVEVFLRDSEPPAHNFWGNKEKLKSNYKQGWKKGLDDMMKAAEARLRQALQIIIVGDSETPDGLAELLPGCSGPVPPALERRFTSSEETYKLDFKKRSLTCTLKISRLRKPSAEDKPWMSTVSVVVKGDRSQEKLPLLSAKVENLGVEVKPKGESAFVFDYEAHAPATVDSFVIEVVASLHSFAPEVLPRMRILVEQKSRLCQPVSGVKS
jgi:hypothetical protein